MRQNHAVLLTRPSEQSVKVSDDLRAAGFTGQIVNAPILRITPRELKIDVTQYPTLLFTSINGVDSARVQADLTGHTCYAVGDGTMRRAQESGLSCVSAGGAAEDLLALLCHQRPATPMLHLRGAYSSGNLAERLNDAGLGTDEAVIYDQQAEPLSNEAVSLLNRNISVTLPVYSPRSAKLVSCALDGLKPLGAAMTVVAISEAAARAWKGPGQIHVADAPDGAAMERAILETCRA